MSLYKCATVDLEAIRKLAAIPDDTQDGADDFDMVDDEDLELDEVRSFQSAFCQSCVDVR